MKLDWLSFTCWEDLVLINSPKAMPGFWQAGLEINEDPLFSRTFRRSRKDRMSSARSPTFFKIFSPTKQLPLYSRGKGFVPRGLDFPGKRQSLSLLDFLVPAVQGIFIFHFHLFFLFLAFFSFKFDPFTFVSNSQNKINKNYAFPP